jgi:hypothetical protein
MLQYATSIGLILVSLTSSCNSSLTSISKNSLINVSTPLSETVNANSYQNQQTDDKLFDLSKVKLKYPMVWVGGVDINEEKQLNSNWVWSFDEAEIANEENPQIPFDRFRNPNYPMIKKDEAVLVDIMNCSGYLGSGKISYKTIDDSMFIWKLTFYPETIATDAVGKIESCGSSAFAIAPQDDKRKNIKINKVDTKKLFSSLPKETQKWLKNKYGSDVHKKGELSLEQDDWTDIDGDGKIDLINIWTNTDEEHSSGLVLMFINGIWEEIYSTQPA